MNWFTKRFSEPSSWAGIGAMIPSILLLAHGVVDPTAITTVLAGLAAVFTPEKGS